MAQAQNEDLFDPFASPPDRAFDDMLSVIGTGRFHVLGNCYMVTELYFSLAMDNFGLRKGIDLTMHGLLHDLFMYREFYIPQRLPKGIVLNNNAILHSFINDIYECNEIVLSKRAVMLLYNFLESCDDDLNEFQSLVDESISPITFLPKGGIGIEASRSLQNLAKQLSEQGKPMDEIEFSISSSPKGGIDIEMKSTTVHLTKQCSVHHPFVEMVLLARLEEDQFLEKKDRFSCSASLVLKAIIDIIGKSSLDALTNVPIVYEPGFVAAKRHLAKLCYRKAYALATSQSLTAGYVNLRVAIWLDSGAAHHVVRDVGILINLRDPPAGTTVRVADGSELPVTKVGDISTAHFRVEDAYLVPGLEMNLLSVRQLARKQIITTFYEHHAVLMRGHVQIGGAIADDETSLYRMRYLTENFL